MRSRRSAWLLALGVAAAVPLLSQGIPTGTLSGRVKSGDQGLPGVTVTATSPSLQGSRAATTGANGDYNIPLLPPGDYEVRFDLQGYQPIKRPVKVPAAQAVQVDQELTLSVSEEIVVTGTYETISAAPQVSTTYEKQLVEDLPVERNIRETVLLVPGVSDNGPGAPRTRAITISGAMSFENLFLVNGVVVNENLRGQPQDLFIEDAIQETTTTTGGVSAEYGRFAGGVVNVITKSGGNDAHGSFRTVLTNQKWESKTPPIDGKTPEQTDKVNKRYEATLGGRILRDRLWFFLAGRDFNESNTRFTTSTLDPFDEVNDERRLEGKLTLSASEGHRVTGSYIKVDRDENGNRFGNVRDTNSLVTRALPNELMALNYSGVLTDSLVVEGQYSQRKFTFENSGSRFTDRIQGTLIVDGPTGDRYWSPTFCGVCDPEKRDNRNFLLKGSWFKSTERLGSHEIAAGVDSFKDIRKANNHQSGSDYRIITSNTIQRGDALYPVLLTDLQGNLNQFIQYNPILVGSQGTDFVTNSLFVNDKWRWSDRLSLNLGLRYDQNDGKDGEGKKVAKDSQISPRLAATYELGGSGTWTLHGSAGRYVAAIANSQGDSTSRGGNPATLRFNYRGPAINADPNGTLLAPDQALRIIFDWFDSQGGPDSTTNLRSISIPGGTVVIRGSLDSPSTDELAFGVTKRFGSRGIVRADLVHREGHDFYSTRTDTTTGPTANGRGDLAVLENSENGLSRKYDGLHTQFQFRLRDGLQIGGAYTLSKLRGTFDGENRGSGPVSATINQYPEYKQRSWNNPSGNLAGDQRHRLRAWGTFDVFNSDNQQLRLSLLQNYFSGHPYGAVGAVATRNLVTVSPAYKLPPANVTYYYTARDAFHTDNITATDLSLNYTFKMHAMGRSIDLFLQPEILNVFNEHGLINVDATVLDATTGGTKDFTPVGFNPFTTQPEEHKHWEKGPKFGKPTNPEDYQQPRTFRFSIGIRL